MTEYYFLDTSDGVDWFLVPHLKRTEWLAWLGGPNARPDWVVPVGTDPSLVIFVAPRNLDKDYE